MAIDRVTIWRNSPSPEIAFDNELFLEAQQSQFVLRDMSYGTAAFAELLRLRVTQPSVIIGSLLFSTAPVEFAFVGPPAQFVAAYEITYRGLSLANSGASHTDQSFAHTVSSDTQRSMFTCHVGPRTTESYVDMTLKVKGSTAGKLLAGSFIKIL